MRVLARVLNRVTCPCRLDFSPSIVFFNFYQGIHLQLVQDLTWSVSRPIQNLRLRDDMYLPLDPSLRVDPRRIWRPCFLPLFAVVAAASLLMGCQSAEKRADREAFGSLAQIVSISPDTTQLFRSGERIRLKVEVSHVMTAESGTIQLVVLAADNSPVGQDSRLITKGRGTSTLEAEFTVPSTTTIRVFTPLVFQGQTSAAVTDGRAFAVVP